MNYLSSDQGKKYILLNFSLVDLVFFLFNLLNFQKTQVTELAGWNDVKDGVVCDVPELSVHKLVLQVFYFRIFLSHVVPQL